MRCILRRRGALVALAAVLAAVGAVAPPAQAAAPSGGFSVRPAHTDPTDPATQTYFKRSVAPGQSFTDEVIVTNAGDAPLDLIVSPVDGLTGATTGAVYANRQDAVVRAGTWLTPAVPTIRLGAHTETSVPFTVRVPEDAGAGDHLAGVAFEDARPHTSGDRFSIKQVIRAVVGVLVRVPGPAVFHAHIDAVELGPLPGFGTSAVMVRFGNNGSKLAKPGLSVSLEGPGAYRGGMTRQLDTVLPGDTISYPVAWADVLASGDYDVTVTVTGGLQPVTFRTRVHLGATLQPRRAATPRRRDGTPNLSWLVALLAALGGALLGALVVRRPAREIPRGRPRTSVSASVPVVAARETDVSTTR